MLDIMAALGKVTAHEPGALDHLLGLPKVREVIRVRASKAAGFPWATTAERRMDAARCLWEVAEGLDVKKVA